MEEKLTPKQQRIYDYIKQFTTQNGYPPAVREIAAAVGLRSPSTVHFHLKALEEAGMIQRGSGKTRAITLVQDPERKEQSKQTLIPLLGSVAAGAPIWADQMIEDYVPFDLHGSQQPHFALRIRGDSMIKAGIMPGDLVIVRQQSGASNGEIVIALIGDEATCKRFSFRGKELWLLPENDAYQPIDGRNARVLGKVIGVIRQYD